MTYVGVQRFVRLPLLVGWLLMMATGTSLMAEPSPAAVAGFNAYIFAVEARLAQQHRSDSTFLVLPVDRARFSHGEVIIEPLTTSPGKSLPGALLHDWRGTAFIPGATAAEFVRILKDFSNYPREFAPQVLQTTRISQNGDRAVIQMQVRQHDVITVVMDITYDVSLGQLDSQHGYSISRSTKISELDGRGHPLSPKDEHGFLWRMNTYWSYVQTNGGLYIQLESVTLTRSIPTGLGWIVGPFVTSVPRKSIEFTLRAASHALRQQEGVGKASLVERAKP